jgi:RNA polymerase sigma-70 factor (ECF subfamily)
MAAGSDELTLAFVHRFQAQVYGLALALSSDGRGAEDIACETFRQAARRARSHDGLRNSVGEWLAALTRETALKSVRTRRLTLRERAARLATIDAGDLNGTDDDRRAGHLEPGPPPEAAVLHLEARAVILAGIGGLTAAEVASVEGIPLVTAKTRIRSAMHRLRVLLTEAGDLSG